MTTCTIDVYLESKSTLLEKITAFTNLISAMETRLVEISAGLNVTVDEYSMDDGQMKVRTKYRSVDDVLQAITNFEKIKQRYVNQYNGRVITVRDARGLN